VTHPGAAADLQAACGPVELAPRGDSFGRAVDHTQQARFVTVLGPHAEREARIGLRIQKYARPAQPFPDDYFYFFSFRYSFSRNRPNWISSWYSGVSVAS
jgi:hypothetical protein